MDGKHEEKRWYTMKEEIIQTVQQTNEFIISLNEFLSTRALISGLVTELRLLLSY